MLGTAAQVAEIVAAVLIPATLLFAAAQTRLLRRQVEAEVTARHVQIYQSLHENMAERVRLFLDHPAYRPAFYDNQPLPDGLDASVAATLAEMSLDLSDTAAVQASALPEDWADPWLRVCKSDYDSSPVIRSYWARAFKEYGKPLQNLLGAPPKPDERPDDTEGFPAPRAGVAPAEQAPVWSTSDS